MRFKPYVLLVVFAGAAACASVLKSTSEPNDMSSTPPSPDPRIGLRGGWWDAGEAIWNLRLVSTTRPSEKFTNASTPGDSRLKNSDLAFLGNYVFQGNYSGYQVWDITDPAKPTLRTAYVCPGSQSDVSVYKNLLFVSAEATNGRTDCGMQGVPDTVSKERARGIRIFDITDVAHPRALATVQTCRGSHTHTVLTDPNDAANVYIYVSGSAAIRSASELQGCSALSPEQDPNSALFRIEVIKVPLANPERAAIVSSPRIFENLAEPAKHAESAADVAAADERRRAAGRAPRETTPGRGPTQCHDITVYPSIGLAGGACAGYGFLLDIKDVAHPKRITAVADSNFSFWHSATFSNDGTKILFSDEWGGGTQPRCRSTDRKEWGADAIFALKDNALQFKSYYKLPAAQTANENCVAHNGTLIPVPGRDIMVQAWYQGGISVFDWTDPEEPTEIAYFDRGPMDATKPVVAGYWSSYWYNGFIVASEEARGLDIFELKPSYFLTSNEIAAAKTVKLEYFNAQEQPKLVWPPSMAVARAYLDQIIRDDGMPGDRSLAVQRDLDLVDNMWGPQRVTALMRIATTLDYEALRYTDVRRVRLLAANLRQLSLDSRFK